MNPGNESVPSLEDQRFKRYLWAVPQPIVVVDVNNRIREVNATFCQVFGYLPQELEGRDASQVLLADHQVFLDHGYTEEAIDLLLGGLERMLTGAGPDLWKGIVINKKKDNTPVWVSLSLQRLRDTQGRIQEYIGVPIDITAYRANTERSKHDIYHRIASLAELRDDETSYHMRRVGNIAKTLASTQGLSSHFIEQIEAFAPMHDIGKVGIPDSLLMAPRPLTKDEWAIMKGHTLLGHKILKGNPDLAMAAEITLGHHERWDGKGYPFGISGQEIPLSARITTLADVYDALRSERPYKPAWGHDQAVAEIRTNAGRHFCPSVVEAFLMVESEVCQIFADLDDCQFTSVPVGVSSV